MGAKDTGNLVNPMWDRGYQIGKQIGREEVVEFIGEEPFEHNYSMYGHEVDDCFACRYEARLKEWGVDENRTTEDNQEA